MSDIGKFKESLERDVLERVNQAALAEVVEGIGGVPIAPAREALGELAIGSFPDAVREIPLDTAIRRLTQAVGNFNALTAGSEANPLVDQARAAGSQMLQGGTGLLSQQRLMVAKAEQAAGLTDELYRVLLELQRMQHQMADGVPSMIGADAAGFVNAVRTYGDAL